MRRATLLLLLLWVSGCSPFSDERVTVDLMIEGVVTSDDTPIPDASVYLGVGGHFTVAVAIDSAVTNKDGRYRIEHAYTYDPDGIFGCGFWMSARAEGYGSTPIGDADSQYGAGCTEEVQIVDIAF